MDTAKRKADSGGQAPEASGRTPLRTRLEVICDTGAAVRLLFAHRPNSTVRRGKSEAERHKDIQLGEERERVGF